MQGARKRSAPLPTKRRCGACQQKHIKCVYENDDEKCKACRANDRKCVVKHRFQHVNPAVKRPRKRANSSKSKGSAVSAEEEINNASGGFTVIDWALPEDHQLTPTIPQLDGSPEAIIEDEEDDDDDDGEGEGDDHVQENEQRNTSNNNNEEQTIHIEDPLANAFSPITQRSGNTASDFLPAQSSRTQIPSPLAQFASPTFENFSASPNILDTIFSPGRFSASALPHASPLSAVGSVPTPGDSQLADKEKAFLLRHFTDVLWKWFDICDPEQHFRRIVPVRALKCPTLMKAICASSAWHLCRKGKYDRERSDFLYENCLKHLIKAMDSPTVGSDDSILIAATIMHNVEELRDLEHTLVLESRGHLVGINIFLDSFSQPQNQNHNNSNNEISSQTSPTASSSDWSITSNASSLRLAALRVAVREELHTCFINQQPLTLPAALSGIDRSFTPASDETWAWRVMLIYRDALANSLQPSTAADWDRIFNDLQSWYNLKPDSFEPTFYAEPDEGAAVGGGRRVLPEMWFLHDSHIIGTIHYHLARIVLATSNPRTPKIGWNRAAALRRVDREVRGEVVKIAGIAMSNCLLPSAMTAASMVITMCAESIAGTDESGTSGGHVSRSDGRIVGRSGNGIGVVGGVDHGLPTDGSVVELQAALFDVLIRAKEVHGWPTEAAQRYVRGLWYGESNEGSGSRSQET